MGHLNFISFSFFQIHPFFTPAEYSIFFARMFVLFRAFLSIRPQNFSSFIRAPNCSSSCTELFVIVLAPLFAHRGCRSSGQAKTDGGKTDLEDSNRVPLRLAASRRVPSRRVVAIANTIN